MGHNSILNAVKLKVQKKDDATAPLIEKNVEKAPFHQDKPMCETLLDLQLTDEEKKLLQKSLGKLINWHDLHTFVYNTFL